MKIAVLRKGCAKLKSFWAAAQWRTLAGIQIGILLKRKVLERLKAEFESIEVINIKFDLEQLEVTVLIDGYKLDISFDSPAGFRVLDEGDLLEFWPDCSSPNGWLLRSSRVVGLIRNVIERALFQRQTIQRFESILL